MKKLFTLLMVALVCVSMTNCNRKIKNQLEELEERVAALEEIAKKTNDDIAALQTIVNALQNNVYVLSVETTNDGYIINFSDGTSATISNGKDGANGKDGINAPVVSIKQDTDGNYYWTLDGEWLIIDGQRVRANGIDGTNGQNGQDGQDAIAPKVRINEDTKEWEISVDGGITWEPTGVIAEGQDGENGSIIVEGETLFQSIDTSNDDYVLLVLTDGTELRLPYYDETAPLFIITNAPELAQIEYGTTAEFEVETENVVEHLINVPEGWHASYNANILGITAPAKDLCHYDKEGKVSVTVVSAEGKMAIVKLNVMAGEWIEKTTTVLRTLTFEDKDSKFNPYELEYYNNKQISSWSDLIAEDQYGDYILGYGTWMGECIPTDESHYCWFDDNNTFLAHNFPYNYDSYCFAGGGHAISNYASSDYSSYGDYTHQLTVYDKDANGLVRNAGGHNGSDNFAIHYGYYDGSEWNQTTEDDLPAIYFKDNTARVIDHLWVCLTTYEYYCLYEGNGLTDPLGEGDYVIIEAIGHKEDGSTSKISTRVADLQNGVIDDWAKWDLTALGKVKKVHFNIIGSNDNGFGFSQPAYFAYDDVAVQFPGESERVFE